MDDQEQPTGGILEPIGAAAVDAVAGVGAELGAIFGGADEPEGPSAAIGRAAADIFDSPRDPASVADGVGGSIVEAAEQALETGGTGPGWTPVGPDQPDSGGIVEALEREAADRLPIDDTKPTGFLSEVPDSELPPDVETSAAQ